MFFVIGDGDKLEFSHSGGERVVIAIPNEDGRSEVVSECGWWAGTMLISTVNCVRVLEYIKVTSPRFEDE